MRFPTSRLLLLTAVAAGFIFGRRLLRAILSKAEPRVGPGPVTQASVPGTPADAAERRLDEAVEETFPASDPIAVRIE